ncbi:hypothetical protein HGRIS_001696 [Hohenbuehelia grisea]|uniref:Uncharacterized protein n=1 Tax=Hohenbuehelia grisea TaxID=104357 RepID=A0ABR3JI76_9AGAR
MILEKQPLPNDPTPADAPPSYNDTIPITAPAPVRNFDAKDSLPSPSSLPGSPTPTSLGGQSPLSPGARKSKGSWFSFTTSRAERELRETIKGLVRDLVRLQPADPASYHGILHSCSDACANYTLTLSSILQERYIEDHSPIYWAIVNRQPEEDEDTSTDHVPDWLTTLLSFSIPLTEDTISEIRYACLTTSDQILFQRLRHAPAFSPLSGTDSMILGGEVPVDDIEVENVPGDEGSFAVNFGIVQFHKRMRISKQISLEFIARDRMWRFEFFVMPLDARAPWPTRQGAWCVALSLLDNSSPTWIDSRLLIQEPEPLPEPDGPNYTEGWPPSGSPKPSKPKPTISLRLKSPSHCQLTPLSQDAARRHQRGDSIIMMLEESMMGSSLQYAGTSYIAADGTLRARLEARLAKPEAECIIC